MKKIIILSIILTGCNGAKIKNPKICYKSYTNFWDNPMPKGICWFGYKEYENGDYVRFNDSCSFYKVGDPIKNLQTQ